MKDDKDKAQETERLKLAVMSHIEHGLGKDPAYSSTFDHYLGLSYTCGINSWKGGLKLNVLIIKEMSNGSTTFPWNF